MPIGCAASLPDPPVMTSARALMKKGEKVDMSGLGIISDKRRYRDNNPAPVLVDGTVVRHPGMPEFTLLSYETDGLVAYIRRISRSWKPAP